MATVKSASGGPIGDRAPNGRDIIKIGGMETSIASAVNAGLLVRNHDGSYSDPVKPAALKDPTAEAAKAPEGKREDTAKTEAQQQIDAFGLPLEAQQALPHGFLGHLSGTGDAGRGYLRVSHEVALGVEPGGCPIGDFGSVWSRHVLTPC
jgi:hypothetical protein